MCIGRLKGSTTITSVKNLSKDTMHPRQDFHSICKEENDQRSEGAVMIPVAPPSSPQTLKKKTGDRLQSTAREIEYTAARLSNFHSSDAYNDCTILSDVPALLRS